jgi:post-segregation antitoxin (ccd killing protein)
LIAELKDVYDLEAQAISQRLGLSVQEVNRRYRAYKALEQMKNDEIYSEFAGASLYPIFHEAVSLPVVRDWLEWDAEANTFNNNEIREQFYQLITPRNVGQDDENEPKIRTFSEVRQLRDILVNDDAKAELLQLDRDLVDAVAVANQDKMARRWRNEIAEARAALSKIPGLEIRNFAPEDLAAINDLINTANQVLEMNTALQTND